MVFPFSAEKCRLSGKEEHDCSVTMDNFTTALEAQYLGTRYLIYMHTLTNY